MKFVFFGTSDVSVGTLNVLKEKSLMPTLVVTTEDKPRGRGHVTTPTQAKEWAILNNVPVIEPVRLDDAVKEVLEKENADVFIVVDYGKIIPKDIFDMPPHKTLNVHYSKLPKWRGASPIHTTILEDTEAWVSIMEIAVKLDEGPVIAQEKLEIAEWPPKFTYLREQMIKVGAELLVKILPDWIDGKITSVPQNNAEATYTRKIKKENADISKDAPEVALRKIRAYEVWPKARLADLIVNEAHIEAGELVLDRVTLPGKKEMNYQDYLRGNSK